MEVKAQDATINRPDGERVIDAPYVINDIDRFVTQLKSEEAWSKKGYNSLTIYKTTGVTIVLSCMQANESIGENTVDGLLTIQVLSGTVDFIMDNTPLKLARNQMITIHPGILHTVTAREESTILLTNVGG